MYQLCAPIGAPINFRVVHIINVPAEHITIIDQVNKVTGQTQIHKSKKSETEDTKDHYASNSPNSSFDSSSDLE